GASAQSVSPLTTYGPLALNNSNGAALTGTTTATTLTLTSGTLDIAGFALTTTDVSGSGGINFSGAGTWNIGGNNTSNGSFTAGGGTVNYNKAGTQTVRTGITYNNLTLSGSGAKDLSGATTVGGTLTLSGTATSLASAGLTLSSVSIGAGTTLNL